MKVEDLRIGNLVWTDIGLPSYNVHTVVAGDFGDYNNKKLKPEMIIPIPLNEEWLKRDPDRVKEWKGNGADYQPETSKTSQRYYRLDEDIHLVFQTWSWRKNEEDEWDTEESVFINYWDKEIYLAKQEVHWAQNVLFYLTGHELEIK